MNLFDTQNSAELKIGKIINDVVKSVIYNR